MNTPTRHPGLRRATVWLAAFAGLLFLCHQAEAQTWVAQAQQDGVTLKKVVSDTLINSGQNFTYTIYWSIPAGAVNVTISDVLPVPLQFQGASFTSACGVPTVSAPTVGTNGTYSLSWASIPGGCSGSMSITVSFPNGTTCNGTSVRNRVCFSGLIAGKDVQFCTPFVTTVAKAVNPWHIGKWVTNASYQGGPCQYATADSVINYQVCVYKDAGTTGQLNLVGGIVRDTLPAGAVLQSSSCGATQTGNIITWNVGNMSALPMYNTICCTFSVLYPRALFPNGSQIKNEAWLSGTLGSAQVPCGTFTLGSGKTCVEIKSITSGTLGKYAYTNGQPGCTGYYLLYICNNGTTPLTSITVRDTVPGTLSSVSIGTVSPGLNATQSGSIITVTNTTTLLPGQCRYVYINFTIPIGATVGSTITNCAWLFGASPNPIQSCASFVVAAPAPTLCLWKEVCNKQPQYAPGAIFRYRLRIQNIGGQAMTGATLTDVLNSNLQYIGNPSYYTTSTWSSPCQGTSNWPGVTLNYNSGTNTVTAALPPIAAVCQTIFYGSCGMYGTSGVPFYFIEFDVKVRDTSALGNIPNNFTIGGGTVVTPVTSNIEYVLVAGTVGFTLDKGIKKPSDPTYSNSITTSAGASVNYRLRMNIAAGSVGLRYVTFADLLPLDNGLADNLILSACGLRGSQFNVAYGAFMAATPSVTQYHKPSASFVDVDGLTIAPLGALFNTGCGTDATAWTAAAIPAASENLGFHFGASAIGTSSATVEFSATVAAAAKALEASCNTFAANGAVRHLINSVITSDVVAGALESGKACVNISQVADSTHCITAKPKSLVSAGTNSSGDCVYTIVIDFTNPNATPLTVWFDSFQGTVSPSSATLPPGGPTSTTLTFTDTPPSNSFICIRFGYMTGPQPQVRVVCDSICYDIQPCSGHCLDSLKPSIKCIGMNTAGNYQYTIGITGWNGNGAGTLVLGSAQGTFSPSSFAIPAGTFGVTTTFTDLPPANSFITIQYGIMGPQGIIICRDSIIVDLPPCPTDTTIDDCCSKFTHHIGPRKIVYNNLGNVSLGTTLVAGPSTIKKFTATIVSVQRRDVCKTTASPWQRAFGDITGGTLVVPPGPGPQLLQIFSRQAVWGPTPPGVECVDWNQGANLKLHMVYPPVPTGKFCRDTLVFAIRYSFTDCRCLTCDTIVRDTVVRYYQYTPWDVDPHFGNGGTRLGLSEKGPGAGTQAAQPPATALVMDDNTHGSFWIINPQSTANNLVVTGVEITSPVQPLTLMQWAFTNGIIFGDVGFIAVRVAKGEALEVKLEFSNPTANKQWPIDVRFAYTDDMNTDVQYSEPIRYIARVPGVAPDIAGIDVNTRPQNIRSYAMYFANKNGYSEPVAAIHLKAKGTARILAVGPVSESGSEALVFPQLTESGMYVISATSGNDNTELQPDETVKPIFITIADADSLNNMFDFETLDANGHTITTGSFILSDPLSRVRRDPNDQAGATIEVVPNPASSSATVTLNMDNKSDGVTLGVYDALGREVLSMINGATLATGAHIMPVNISGLAAGTYYFTVTTSMGTASTRVTVVR